MALSEDEKRVLAQLEELMSAEDPQFAQSMAEQTKTVSSITPRAIAIGVLAILLGLGIVFGAVAIKVPVLGVLGNHSAHRAPGRCAHLRTPHQALQCIYEQTRRALGRTRTRRRSLLIFSLRQACP